MKIMDDLLKQKLNPQRMLTWRKFANNEACLEGSHHAISVMAA